MVNVIKKLNVLPVQNTIQQQTLVKLALQTVFHVPLLQSAHTVRLDII